MRYSVTRQRFFAGVLVLASVGLIAPQARAQAPADIKGDAILKHQIGIVAQQYVELLHADKMDEAMKLASTSAQAQWKKRTPDDKKDSIDFLKRILPNRSELLEGITKGGLIRFDSRTEAALNIIKIESTSPSPGTTTGTSTTVAIPFMLEGGQWKVAR